MLMQCAFACWEASGAVTITYDAHSEICTHPEPDPTTLLEACRRGTVDWDSEDLAVVRETAYLYCIESMQPPQPDMGKDTSSRGSFKKIWGVDFLGPFVRTLFTLSEVPHQHSLAVDDLKVLEKASAIAAGEKNAIEANRKALEDNLFLSERDRSLANEQKLARRIEVDRKYVDSCMSGRIPISAGRSAVKHSEVSDMQRLMKRTEHLGSAAIGIHLLIGGTKVELWPLFACYCNGTDSSTPSTLTGPRLYTLMSRCNLLTIGTSLSDIGLLLHQVSAQLHAKAPLPLGSLLPAEITALSYEQFIVFLCAFSELFYKDIHFSSEMESGDTDSTDSSMTSISSTMTRNTAGRQQPCEGNLSSVCTTPTKESGDSTSSDAGQSWPLYRAKDISISSGNIIRGDMRYSARRKSMASPPGLNVIICSAAGGTAGQQSTSLRWLMQWKEPMESSKTFRTLLINELLPSLINGSSSVCSDGIQRGYGSRDSDEKLDRFAVLFSLDVVLALQGVEFFLRTLIKGDSNGCQWNPTLPRRNEGTYARSSRDSSNPQSSSCSSTSPATALSSMACLLEELKRIGVIPQLIAEARFFQLVVDIMSRSNDGQYSSPANVAGQLHGRSFLKTRCQSQNGQVADIGLTRDCAAATADEQARVWVDWHIDAGADLAHMQWIVGAVALEIVVFSSNYSPPTDRQSRTHPDIEVRTP